MDESVREVLEYLEPKAGRNLRSVLQYSDETVDVVYLRDDIENRYTEEEIEHVVEDFRERRPTDAVSSIGNVGDLHADVRLYDNAVVVHIPQRSRIGTVVTFEPEAAKDLVVFAYDLLRVIHQTTPQSIESAPSWGDENET